MPPIYLVTSPAAPHVPRKVSLNRIWVKLGTLGNLKCIEASSEEAKESCTHESTVVANTSHPDILGLTQRYAGGNKKEESPYGGKNRLCSMPGMVAKLRSTERSKHSQNMFVLW